MSAVFPSLPLGPQARWAAAAALAYLTAGLTYFTVTGTPLADALPRPERAGARERAVHVVLAVLVVLGGLVVWPAAPVLRWSKARRARRRLSVGSGGGPLPVPSLPVERFAAEAARIARCCRRGDLSDALLSAAALSEQADEAYGSEHPAALDAVELLADVSHRIGDDARAVLLYLQVVDTVAGDPGGTERALAALGSALAVWLEAPAGPAYHTGSLLLGYLRVFSGPQAPTVAAAERRMRALTAPAPPERPSAR